MAGVTDAAGAGEALAARVQELTEALGSVGDPIVRGLAEDLAGSLIQMYGDGLARIVDVLDRAGEPGAAIRRELEDDGVVSSMLLMHDLYGVPLEARVREALDSVRPYMESHGGDVELLGIEDDIVQLRLNGHCRGCTASSATLAGVIEEALRAAAPELAGMDVEADDAPAHPPPAGAVLPMAGGGGVELPMAYAGGATAPPPAPSRPVAAATAHEAEGAHCELCPMGLATDHRHLLALTDRRILCVCETCWSLKTGEADYVPTGNRVLRLGRLAGGDDAWAAFEIPIGLAFLMRSSETNELIALYPSPAGATERVLDETAWDRLVAENPTLADLEPDAEALVVNRLGAVPEHALVPIDQAYALVGLVKSRWEGITGGRALEGAVDEFFAGLKPS